MRKTDQKLYNVPDANRTYGIPERHLRYLISARKIETVRIGRRVFIPGAALDALVRDGFRAASDGDRG